MPLVVPNYMSLGRAKEITNATLVTFKIWGEPSQHGCQTFLPKHPISLPLFSFVDQTFSYNAKHSSNMSIYIAYKQKNILGTFLLARDIAQINESYFNSNTRPSLCPQPHTKKDSYQCQWRARLTKGQFGYLLGFCIPCRTKINAINNLCAIEVAITLNSLLK